MPLVNPPVNLNQTPTFTLSGDTTDRNINVGVTTVNELSNVLATLMRDLATAGIVPVA